MATKSRAKQVKRALRNADDFLFLFTGKRLKNVVGRAATLFGEELAKKGINFFAGPEEPELPPNDPYSIIGMRPDSHDAAIRGAYRGLAREYHPDTGSKPDTVKFQAATEAYNAIMAERQARKEKECAAKS